MRKQGEPKQCRRATSGCLLFCQRRPYRQKPSYLPTGACQSTLFADRRARNVESITSRKIGSAIITGVGGTGNRARAVQSIGQGFSGRASSARRRNLIARIWEVASRALPQSIGFANGDSESGHTLALPPKRKRPISPFNPSQKANPSNEVHQRKKTPPCLN